MAPRRTKATPNEAILAIWTTITGASPSKEERKRFLARRELNQLAQYPVNRLISAGNEVAEQGSLHLRAWLSALQPNRPVGVAARPPSARVHKAPLATAATHQPIGAAKKARAGTAQTRQPAVSGMLLAAMNGDLQPRQRDSLRSANGQIPQRPVDSDLAKRIGPVQKYGDPT